MALQRTTKRRLVTSLHNLSTELQEAVKAEYPLGFSDSMIRIEKPNGDFFYAVPYATEETDYLVKIDVKVDGKNLDDKELFDADIKGSGDDDILSSSESEEEEEPRSKRGASSNFDDEDEM